MAFGDRDPEKLRDWHRRAVLRAQEKARNRAPGTPYSSLSRSTGLDRGKGPVARLGAERPPEGPLTSLEWKLAVYERAEGFCEVTGIRLAPAINPWVWHAHHVISKRALRDRHLYHRVWDPRNGMLVAAAVHLQHEGGGGAYGAGRIPRERIRSETLEFAAEIGPWAEDLLGPPAYPCVADPRDPTKETQ